MVRSPSLILPAMLLALCGAPASALAQISTPSQCAERFHRALQGAPMQAFEAIKPMRQIARKGDARLPGKLIMSPPRERREGDQLQALRAAVDLAEGQGRAGWAASANGRWIVDRTIADLGDFMGQGPAPYLCGGVENFVGILEGYLDRISPGGGRSLEELRVAQASRAQNSIADALAAMRPVPKPRYAPDIRPIAIVGPVEGEGPAIELRRGFDGIIGGRAMMLAVSHVGPTSTYGPKIDPDLPMKVAIETPLATVKERLGAIEALVSAAMSAGFLPEEMGFESRRRPEEPGEFRAILASLSALAPMIDGPKSEIADPLVRRRMLAALSDIEILDYLAVPDAKGADPLINAIKKTFDAILKARQASMRG